MVLDAFRLEGKVAIVTGCDTGLDKVWPWRWLKPDVT